MSGRGLRLRGGIARTAPSNCVLELTTSWWGTGGSFPRLKSIFSSELNVPRWSSSPTTEKLLRIVAALLGGSIRSLCVLSKIFVGA